jgi:YHS domain-containing protein
MRLLLLGILIYLGYRALKALVFSPKPSVRSEREPPSARIDDVMVKDPYCESYFPARKGIQKVIKGETLYFCSKDCRDKYMEQIKESKG